MVLPDKIKKEAQSVGFDAIYSETARILNLTSGTDMNNPTQVSVFGSLVPARVPSSSRVSAPKVAPVIPVSVPAPSPKSTNMDMTPSSLQQDVLINNNNNNSNNGNSTPPSGGGSTTTPSNTAPSNPLSLGFSWRSIVGIGSGTFKSPFTTPTTVSTPATNITLSG